MHAGYYGGTSIKSDCERYLMIPKKKKKKMENNLMYCDVIKFKKGQVKKERHKFTDELLKIIYNTGLRNARRHFIDEFLQPGDKSVLSTETYTFTSPLVIRHYRLKSMSQVRKIKLKTREYKNIIDWVNSTFCDEKEVEKKLLVEAL